MRQARAMRFIILFPRNPFIPNQHPPTRERHLRTIFDGTFTVVRDRGLDHAVEREKNLKPLINLKNLIKREPSKSLPISIIKESIELPFRSIDFVRKYPSIFQEFLAGGIQPHIKLTAEAINLDAEEQLMYQNDAFKQQLADRLLKLLMISRVHNIPLRVLDCLKWDLGLPDDYITSMIPEFPDYFRVVGRSLELVCWSNDLAVSVMEKSCGLKGKELAFPVQFSSGFEMDKRYEKWLREWHKLPYVSPYENAAYLSASSDESDKWIVGVLHEILHILVPKKTEKDNVLMLGEWLGLRSRFKRALLQHPGIFYISSKIGTYTVVLREGYKRGSLVGNNQVMDLRSQYIHLMNMVKEDSKASKAVHEKSSTNESNAKELEGEVGEDEDDDEKVGEEREEESGYEAEDAGETVLDDYEEPSPSGNREIATNRRGREHGKVKLGVDKPLRDSRRDGSARKVTQKAGRRNLSQDAEDAGETVLNDREQRFQSGRRESAANRRGRDSRKVKLSVDKPLRDSQRERLSGKVILKAGKRNLTEVSNRRQVRDRHEEVESSQHKSRSFKSRGRSFTSKRTPVS